MYWYSSYRLSIVLMKLLLFKLSFAYNLIKVLAFMLSFAYSFNEVISIQAIV